MLSFARTRAFPNVSVSCAEGTARRVARATPDVVTPRSPSRRNEGAWLHRRAPHPRLSASVAMPRTENSCSRSATAESCNPIQCSNIFVSTLLVIRAKRRGRVASLLPMDDSNPPWDPGGSLTTKGFRCGPANEGEPASHLCPTIPNAGGVEAATQCPRNAVAPGWWRMKKTLTGGWGSGRRGVTGARGCGSPLIRQQPFVW